MRANRSLGIATMLLAAFSITATFAVAAGPQSGGRGGKTTAMAPPPALQKTLSSAEAKEIAALPEGPGKVMVTERCMLCHGAGLITAQHKDAAAWGRTVTQMRTWGTPIQDEDQAAIVAYLTEHYGPKAAPAPK